MNASHICLNMIVKNETPVLGRLIRSVKDIIDYYVIVDTGSDDGTPELIKTEMARYGIAGVVIDEPWVNFGVNRNLALQHACQRRQHGWLLFIDADEELCYTDAQFYRQLEPGKNYGLRKHHGRLRYALPNLVDISRHRWRWRGVVHEYLEPCDGPFSYTVLDQVWIHYHQGEGARSRRVTQEQKYLGDAALLEAELQKNPNDTRSQFYLAQSYRDAGHLDKAYQHYLKRVGMGGWVEETYIAQLEAGHLAVKLELPYATIMAAYQHAYQILPSRAEALYNLAAYSRLQQQLHLAFLYARQGIDKPYPARGLFVQQDVYQWRIWDELAVAAYWAGDYQTAKMAAEEIFRRQAAKTIEIDEENMKRITNNFNYIMAKLYNRFPSKNPEQTG